MCKYFDTDGVRGTSNSGVMTADMALTSPIWLTRPHSWQRAATRKAFVGALTGEKVAAARVHGVQIIRMHDVQATVAALAVTQAVGNPAASGL